MHRGCPICKVSRHFFPPLKEVSILLTSYVKNASISKNVVNCCYKEDSNDPSMLNVLLVQLIAVCSNA